MKQGKLFIILAILIILLLILVGLFIEILNNATRKNIEVSKNVAETINSNDNSNQNKEITDAEILAFAESEVKKKLRHPEDVIFQNEEIIGRQDNQFVVSVYSISKDKNNEEGRLHFVMGIQNDKGNLKTFNIATNQDSCNVDVAEEFENLVSEKKYDLIYENLFASLLKEKLSKQEFVNYNLDLTNSKVEAKPEVDSNNYLKYITTTIKDKNGQYWIMIIKNGMIYSFSKVMI